MSTYFPKQGEIARKWYVVDANGQTLGRLASQVARILMGKENPKYTPFLDTGDHVIVINAAKVKVTGMKVEQKVYQHYTGYPGGLRTEELSKRFARKPELVIEDGEQVESLQERQAPASGTKAGSACAGITNFEFDEVTVRILRKVMQRQESTES